MLAEAARHPKRLVERLPKTLDKRAREVAVLAAVRYARNDVSAAAVALEGPLAQRLEEADLKYLWGVVAYEGARASITTMPQVSRRGDTRSTTASSPGKRARPCAIRAGVWCARRSTACRSAPRTSRRGCTGTDARSAPG